MERIIYVDGEYLPKSQAKVSVFDHGLLYGDGVFEGIRFYGRNIFRMQQHNDRLYSSARALGLKIPVSPAEVTAATQETCRRNEMDDGYIRLVVTRGMGDLGLSPWLCSKASIIIIVDKISLYDPKYYTEGLAIVTAATRRTPHDSLSPRIKSLNYLNNILAKMEGAVAGAVEVLMLNHQGYVVEASADNVFLVKDGALHTPPLWQGPLPGITRATVIELARGAGVAVREEPMTMFDVYDADEMFLTGTAAEMVPVRQIDGRPVGEGKPGPVTARLRKLFQEITPKDGVRF